MTNDCAFNKLNIKITFRSKMRHRLDFLRIQFDHFFLFVERLEMESTFRRQKNDVTTSESNVGDGDVVWALIGEILERSLMIVAGNEKTTCSNKFEIALNDFHYVTIQI